MEISRRTFRELIASGLLPAFILLVSPGLATAEAGYPNLEATAWFGMVAPARTPANTIGGIIAALQSAIAVPEVRSKLVAQGLYPIGKCGADFGAHLQRQHQEYERVIAAANIRG